MRRTDNPTAKRLAYDRFLLACLCGGAAMAAAALTMLMCPTIHAAFFSAAYLVLAAVMYLAGASALKSDAEYEWKIKAMRTRIRRRSSRQVFRKLRKRD